MKKTLCALWCAALAAALLSGCGQSGEAMPKLDPDSPVSLELWHYYNGPQKEVFDALVTEFNETVGRERGIVVEAFSQGGVNELIDKVMAAAEKKVGAEDIPDVFAAYADTAYAVDKMGLLADLSPYLTEEELAEYRQEFIDEGRISGDGSLKIFPIAKSVELLLLNKTDWDAFAAATGASEDELQTMEGITRTAERYYAYTDGLTPDVAGDGKAFFGRDAMANYIIIGCRQLGEEIFQVENGVGSVHVDAQAMRRIWDNYYVPYLNGWFSDEGRYRSDTAHNGTIIALVGSSSGASYFPTEISLSNTTSYPIEYAAYPAPIFEGGEPYAVQQGAGMCVTKSDKKTEYAATVFLEWFTESQRNAEFSAGSGYLPVTNDALTHVVLQAALSNTSYDKRIAKTLDAALEEIDACTLYVSAPFEGSGDARNVLEDALTEKCQADRQAVLAAVEQGAAMDEVIAQYDTDENFDAWLASLTEKLQACLP